MLSDYPINKGCMLFNFNIIIIIYSICIVLYNVLTLKRCFEYYRIDSDFINLGYINLKMSSVYQVYMY